MTIPRQTDPAQQGPPREIYIPGEMPKEISAVSFVNVLLRHRTMILIVTLLFGFSAGFQSISSAKRYTVHASFMPKGARGSSQLGGLAAQFGINLAGGDAMNSPQLYTDLMETRTVLWPVAQKRYRVNRPDSGALEGDLVRIYNIQGRPNVREVRAVNTLRGAVRSNVIAKTGVIEMSVSTGFPDLSLQIATNVLSQLNEYNVSNRQQSAAAEREFVDKQVVEKGLQLRQAEADFERFLEGNRQYRASPQLMLEYGRLQRIVDMRNTLYTRMLEASENARIEEVRNLPVISIIEAPQLPIEPDARGGIRRTAIGLLTGFVLAVLFAFVRDKFARSRDTDSDEVIEFAALRREALGDLTHPWRPLTRAIGARRRA